MASAPATLNELQMGYQEIEKQLDTTQDRDRALELAIEAAQLCMKALKLATDGSQKSAYRSKANSFLNKAESIKNGRQWTTPSAQSGCSSGSSSKPPGLIASPAKPAASLERASTARKLREPVNGRSLSIKERELILRASRLNGFKFPPWEKTPQADLFSRKTYTEDNPLRLSEVQESSLASWMRAAEALPPPSMVPDGTPRPSPIMASTQPIDLVQDVASDCSVVASLCAIAARESRGSPTILRGIIYPFDTERNTPKVSSNGLYVLRLNFNGSWRIVTIDDLLPVCKSSRMIHTVDLNCPSLLWPALLEKAYLKVRGGYDFPGSNSCTDLWVLTGWIPEQIFLQDEATDPYAVWKRIQKAFQYGDVLVSLGTGRMSRQTEKALGLAAEHNYAVLDLREEGERRMILLKNPWREERVQSNVDNLVERQDGVEEDLIPAEEWDARRAAQQNSDSKASIAQLSGTKWMELNEVIQNFESIYLNWNPGLFSCRGDIHFHWTFQGSRGLGTNFVDTPQFSVSCKEKTDVWLLLCRHFTDTSTIQTTQPLVDIQQSPNMADSAGYLSLYAFERGGDRVRTHDNPLKRSQYVDSAQVLLQLEMPAHGNYTIVPSEQDMPIGTQSFTLMAFSSKAVELADAVNPYPNSTETKSSWTVANAGGNGNAPSFPSNPQFKLSVPRRTRLAIHLDSTKPEYNVNVKLLYGGGKRASKVTRQDIILDSGDYRAGSASAELDDLEAGAYTIICSTFEVGQEGRFRLRVDSTAPCALAALPGEAAGRFRVDDIHPAMFQQGVSILAAPLHISRMVKMTAIARAYVARRAAEAGGMTRLRSRSPVRLYFALGHNAETCRVLAASSAGEFGGSEAGVRTEDIDLWPGMGQGRGDVWLVLERLSPPGGGGGDGEEEGFAVELLVDGLRGKDWGIGVWRVWED